MGRTQQPPDVVLLAVLFAVSGATHLVRPELFKPLMPAWVPAHDEVILGSGLAELACAAGLLVPATRRSAGLASAALLVAVFPGNLKMALDSTRTGSTRSRMVSLGRLPLQLPLIRVALRAGLGRRGPAWPTRRRGGEPVPVVPHAVGSLTR